MAIKTDYTSAKLKKNSSSKQINKEAQKFFKKACSDSLLLYGKKLLELIKAGKFYNH